MLISVINVDNVSDDNQDIKFFIETDADNNFGNDITVDDNTFGTRINLYGLFVFGLQDCQMVPIPVNIVFAVVSDQLLFAE